MGPSHSVNTLFCTEVDTGHKPAQLVTGICRGSKYLCSFMFSLPKALRALQKANRVMEYL